MTKHPRQAVKIGAALCAGAVTVVAIVNVLSRAGPPRPANISPGTAVRPAPAAPAGELSIGSPSAPLVIYEYTDFKCPECNKFHRAAGATLRREFIDTGRVRLVVRPYPTFGEDAGLALYGSYCALAQGRLASYHDELFDYMWRTHYGGGTYDQAARPTFTPQVLTARAAAVGLDNAAFETCLRGKTHEAAYTAALHKAAADEVQGTPTVIVGRQKVVGNQPYEVYKTLIEVALRP